MWRQAGNDAHLRDKAAVMMDLFVEVMARDGG